VNRRGLLGLFAGAASLAALSGCDADVPAMITVWRPPYYAKLKVEVDTPEGVRSGYSVIEIKWGFANRSFNIKGEAVAVDLPKGETLFVLLRSAASVDWAAYLHENVKLEGDIPDHETLYRRVAANRTVWPVARRRKTVIEDSDNYPYFVRFKDIKDPKSVEQVNPDALAKSFGAGVTLKSLTVQMTDEPVTIGIERRLVWLGSIKGKNLDGSNLYDINAPLNAQLNSSDFHQGVKK
jgi:hypothetical protein